MLDPNYAKHILRFVNIEIELKSLFEALKNFMLALSFSK
jgi:hypothetical protein